MNRSALHPILGHHIVGDGPQPVIVLHEWLGNHANYDGILPYLDTDAFTYVFADLRGYGLSRDLAGQHTLQEAADDVLALANRLGFERLHLVAHSMSGLIAQYLMCLAAPRLKRVVCVSPVPASGFMIDADGLASLRASVADDTALRRAIDARTGGRYSAVWLDRKLSIARQATEDAMLGYLDMFTSSDFSDRMAGLTTPFALITGAQDIPFYHQANLLPKFQTWFPTLQATEIHDAGHYAMMETPILFASLIERHLTDPGGDA
jgi:3-oxoadipate enol-lactonase